MRIRRGNAMLYGLLGVLVVSAGCRHQAATQTPRPPAVTPPPAQQPTVTLEASRSDISRGQSVTLRWSATNATSVRVAPEVGSVAAEGATSVAPTQSTTYTAMATGPGGSATAGARVTVSVPTAAAATPQPSLEEMFTKEVRDAFFDYDRASIRDDARSALSKTAEFLRSHPKVAIVIEGHCDERGSTEYNVALGDRRSDAAKDFLLSQGVTGDRIQTVSYGKERPFCAQENESCWQQNRRAHFRMAGTNASQLSGN
jgi:peptidoglycan-associated lipoprotein